MADGQSIEGKGVTPDQLILPSAADLAGGRDPVRSATAEMLNVSISPEEAGRLFPYHWPANDRAYGIAPGERVLGPAQPGFLSSHFMNRGARPVFPTSLT
jgi:hypothetical protein